MDEGDDWCADEVVVRGKAWEAFGGAADNTTGALGPTGWCREKVRRAGYRGPGRW